MPVISRFFGVVVFMYWRDHAPPHFHARYGDEEIEVEIETGIVIGGMNRRALAMVQEGRERHRAELLADWRRAEEKRELRRIQPLE
jgi:hypothetical protein